MSAEEPRERWDPTEASFNTFPPCENLPMAGGGERHPRAALSRGPRGAAGRREAPRHYAALQSLLSPFFFFFKLSLSI